MTLRMKKKEKMLNLSPRTDLKYLLPPKSPQIELAPTMSLHDFRSLSKSKNKLKYQLFKNKPASPLLSPHKKDTIQSYSSLAALSS